MQNFHSRSLVPLVALTCVLLCSVVAGKDTLAQDNELVLTPSC
jgi:hypothetical protein